MLPNPRLLAFDTSAAHCAVALFAGDEIIAEHIEPMTKGQAERLFPLCEEVLDAAGINWSDLDGIGVCVGPGNFTGVRVGVSAARGLALSLNKPAIGISKLEAMGLNSQGTARVVMDARRNRVYVQEFEHGTPKRPPALTAFDDLPKDGAVIIAPDDAQRGLFDATLPPALSLPSAVAHLAVARLGEENQRPAPLYLQDADAALPSDPPPRILP